GGQRPPGRRRAETGRQVTAPLTACGLATTANPIPDEIMFNFALKARPYFGALVLMAALLTAGGIYSVTRMPSGVYPEITFPRIAVVARKPGLDLRHMELQVTVPLEQAVSPVIRA